MSLFTILLPEILLVGAACVLFLLAFAGAKGNGRVAASIGLLGVLGALITAIIQYKHPAFHTAAAVSDAFTGVAVSPRAKKVATALRIRRNGSRPTA